MLVNTLFTGKTYDEVFSMMKNKYDDVSNALDKFGMKLTTSFDEGFYYINENDTYDTEDHKFYGSWSAPYLDVTEFKELQKFQSFCLGYKSVEREQDVVR